MKLAELARFMQQKRNEFENAIVTEAKKLKLQDIINEIEFKATDFNHKDFEYGQRITFLLHQANHTVYLDEKEIALYGNLGINLATFKGPKVTKYYKQLADAIIIAREEYINNLPF